MDDDLAISKVAAEFRALAAFLTTPPPPPAPSRPLPYTGVDPSSALNPFSDKDTKNILRAKKLVKDAFVYIYEGMVSICRNVGNVEPSAHKIVIAGGAISSILRGDAINDFDVFVLDASAGDILACKSYLKSSGQYDLETYKDSNDAPNDSGYIGEDFGSNKDIIRTMTATLIPTWAGADREAAERARNGLVTEGIKIQFIFTKYTTREKLLAHFDYEHCKGNYSPFPNKFAISSVAYKAIMNKTLIPCEGITPAAYRTKKFIDRGWFAGSPPN